MNAMHNPKVMTLKELGGLLDAGKPGLPVYGISIDRSEPRLFLSLNLNEPEVLCAAMFDPSDLESLRIRQTVYLELEYGHTQLREVQFIDEEGSRILLVYPVIPEPTVVPKPSRAPLKAGWSSTR